MTTRSALFLVLAVLASGYHGRAVAADWLAVDRLLRTAPSGSRTSVVVFDIDAGRPLYQHRPDTACRLASVTKLYVSAAALLGLGADYTFTTSLVGLGPIDDGSLPGLGIIGRGSPCLDEHFTDKQPNRIFISWAEALRARGIERIDGDLLVDASFFSGPGKPPTWPQDLTNQQKWYSAPASAFAWNDNCIEVRVVPGKPGERGRVETRPRSPRIAVVNKSTSLSKGGSRVFLVSRARHSNTVTVSGSYSKTTSWYPLAIHDHANLLAGDHCKAVFEQAGLPISGQVRLGHIDPGETVLFEQRDPLLPAITLLNTRSQNFYGEQMIRTLGRELGGVGSLEEGLRQATRILSADLGLDAEAFTLLDGSGLSYDNQASARNVCELLAAMAARDPHGHFHTSLKDRSRPGVPARVKTGSLAVARCLAGYVDGKSGRRYAFAILLNRASAKSIGWASRLRNKLFDAIATELGR